MKRYLFIDRDGTLIEEPPDQQIDSYAKFRLVEGVVPALIALRDAGYRMVIVSNQDGLGTDSFPRSDFEGPQALLMQILASQGIEIEDVLIDESFEHENRMIDGTPSRKPGIGMLLPYLRDREVDMAASWVIGDRETDLQMARNLGCGGLRIGVEDCDWSRIVGTILGRSRQARIERRTAETRIEATLDIGSGAAPQVNTGLPFFDHMLEQLGKHGDLGLRLDCTGDLQVDDHHSIEDCALTIGAALRRALGEKRGISRYGDAVEQEQPGAASGDAERVALAMDESLAFAAVDLSGRPGFHFSGTFSRDQVGGLSTEMVPHFFRSLSDSAALTLHLEVRGENTHHQVEACFKAVGRALRQALVRQGGGLPSTKGVLA